MLHTIAWLSLSVAACSALVIALDELSHPRPMWIMNIVWPVTALYFSVFAIPFYVRFGRRKEKSAASPTHSHGEAPPKISWPQIAVATSHCGAGCTLADIATEFALFGLGVTLFGSPLWASYIFDFIAAWLLGICFQYFTIKPMRDLSSTQALWSAIKVDTLSILTFQVGMYSWMAITYFYLFPHPHLHPTQATYWLMMQIAMLFGFLTAYPTNRWLLRKGVKEVMA
ncbi:MAG: DUF4396 domain-containing protein [Acidobacteriaceae bacterium]